MKWVRVPLADLSETIDYGVTASAKFNEGNVRFLRITDIQDNTVNWTTVPYCDAPSKKVANALLRDGDIVFARTGATTGKSYLLKRSPKNVVFASYLIRVRPSPKVDSDYLNHFFNTPDYWRQIKAKAQGAAQEGVNATKLSSLEIPLPPLDEQKRIAAILDKADALRRQRRQALTLLDSLTQSIFLEMFGDPAINSKKFPLMKVGKIAEKYSDGPFGSNLKSQHYVSHGIRVIRLQNIGVGDFIDNDRAYISEEHFSRMYRHECRPGDVLIGTLGEPNLRACVQPSWLARALNKADCVQFRPNKNCVLSEYFSCLLNQKSTARLVQGLVLGQTRGRISMGRLRELELPIAPLTLQSQFVSIVGVHERQKQFLRESAGQLATLFASLQDRAFSGQL